MSIQINFQLDQNSKTINMIIPVADQLFKIIPLDVNDLSNLADQLTVFKTQLRVIIQQAAEKALTEEALKAAPAVEPIELTPPTTEKG